MGAMHMVRLTSITTKTGDDGTTGLVDGSRVPKHHPRIQAIGAIDETNSILGLARCTASPQEVPVIKRIQNDLFDLGADLATPLNEKREGLRITSEQVARLEAEQKSYNDQLPPLTSFIIPGNTIASGQLYFARALARRAERCMTELNQIEPVNPEALKYINRLSDFLFVLVRFNDENKGNYDLWQPAANQ